MPGESKPKRTHKVRRKAPVPRSGGVWGERVRQRLKQLMETKGITSNRAFARECGVHDRRISDWLTTRLPSADNLRQIANRFDVSIDWLLGFDDVPMLRTGRARVGVLSEELFWMVVERIPTDAFALEVLDPDLSHFANRLVDEWWHSRLLVRATDAAKKFRELAFEIEKATRSPQEPRDSVLEGANTINQCLSVAMKLESPLVGWGTVDFRFPSRASQRRFRTNVPRLATPFPVIGGWAFIWRYPDHDLAIYIERGAGFGSVGEVRLKRGTPRTPRFLVELPPIPGHASKRSEAKRPSVRKKPR